MFRSTTRQAFCVLIAIVAILVAFPRAAFALGTFKLKTTEATEVSGGWRLFVTIELPKAPLTAHQTMKFVFTKTAVLERSLVDGKSEPVMNRQPLQTPQPSVESLDVDFADPSGKVWKGTRFDFMLTRTRGYEAGEYKVELRTSDGLTIGQAANLTLKGDNPVVDRRSIAFSAKEKGTKKIDAYDAGAAAPGEAAPVNPNLSGPTEVAPVGTATGYIPREAFVETEEEKIKTRPKGCGCEVIGLPLAAGSNAGFFLLAPIVGLGLVAARRRAARNAG